MNSQSVFWFRRDLRLDDNHGLSLAKKAGVPVHHVFIFDQCILRSLPKDDARVAFIRGRLEILKAKLGDQLTIYDGDPLEVWPRILKQHQVKDVFCNEDYEPYAIARDAKVAALVRSAGAEFHAVKDQVVFAKDEVVKDNGEPYRVFTPYSNAWLRKFEPPTVKPSAMKPKFLDMVKGYAKQRDRMDLSGTSHLGVHLRFGTVSVRKLIATVKPLSPIFLKELIWREFFMQILFHFPHTVNEPFDPRYKKVKWRDSESDFNRWCAGETGYPVVDAGMRELNETGFMHNRARMVTASFLTKHLLIDWRRGERYFASKLMDFELASNVGNWQWVAGCGCDAAPYFRVFNPTLQAEKFDPDGDYVKKWVREEGTSKYPKPMVEHSFARERALKVFSAAVGKKA